MKRFNFSNQEIVKFTNKVLDEKSFAKVLKYERFRCDREEKYFSLVVFHLKDTCNAEDVLNNIKEKIRKIDVIGNLSDNIAAIILPVTDNNQSIAFIKNVLRNFNENIICYKLYTYPEKWININNMFTDSICVIDELFSADKNYLKRMLKAIHRLLNATVRRIPVWKRLFDFMVSGILLLILAPLFAIVSAYIKLISPGPVFYIQKRVGYKGKHFDFYKFRSMHMDRKQETLHQSHVTDMFKTDKPMVKMDSGNDPRIYRGAKLLRKTSIDELPQLINILKGDMSLVGPRPCLPYEEKEYFQWQRNRFDIIPGMTGLWQVSGKNKLTFKEMIRLDINYIKKLSLKLDLLIMFLTIPTVFSLALEKTGEKLKRGKKN